MSIAWITICMWSIIVLIMLALYRRLWIFFGGAVIALLIAYFQSRNIWLIVIMCLSILIAIPFLLQDIKLSKMQSLEEHIKYIRDCETELVSSWDEKNKLNRLKSMTLLQWVQSWFKK